MKKLKIYLASSISEYVFRNHVKNGYSNLFDIIDPFKENIRNKSNEEIVEQDLRFIDECDLVLVYIEKATIGTTMEIKYAFDKGKNVYSIIKDSDLYNDIWLNVHNTKKFRNIDDAMVEIIRLFSENKEQNTNELGSIVKKDIDTNEKITEWEIRKLSKSNLAESNSRKNRYLKTKIEQNDEEQKYENMKTFEKNKGESMGNIEGTKNVNMGEVANAGMTRDDSKTATRLLDKQWSPMIVRKYYVSSWPCWVGLITDCNLNDLDIVVQRVIDEAEALGFLDGNIQSCRNFCGFLSDKLDEHYDNIKKGSVEGIAIAWYVDKCFISSLAKDEMTHKSCRDEFYSILKILPHI